MVTKKILSIRPRYIKKLVILSIDIFLFLLFSPILLLLIPTALLCGRVMRKQKAVIFAGLEHVIDKTVVRGRFFEDKGFKVLYYSFETSGNRSNAVSKNSIIKAKNFIALDIIAFFLLILKTRPVYIELYFEKSGINQIFYSLTSLMNILIISIHRGIAGEYRRKKVRNRIRLKAYQMSDAVYYRDIKMKDFLGEEKSICNKIFHDCNKVKIKPNPSYDRINKMVLYLNSIIKNRRVDLLIKSVPAVVQKYPDVVFTIVGCRNEKEYNYVQNLVKETAVEGYVKVKYWTNDPTPYYENASVFVFPADYVFCNFSLIECMERGVPAVAADVEDADKIINHGVNGYLVKQNAKDIAVHIIKLISDEELRISMGKEARKTIVEKFNDKDRMVPVFKLLKKRYPEILH